MKIGDKVIIKRRGIRCEKVNLCPHGCPFVGKIGTIVELGTLITVNDFLGCGTRYCSGFTKEVLELVDRKNQQDYDKVIDLSHIKKYKVAQFLEGLK